MKNRVEDAVELFKSGYNCAQAVFAAYADFYGVERELALKLSSSFGQGVGGMYEMCGSVCGMSMIVGLEIGITLAKDSDRRKENYRMVQKLADDFREETGSIVCKLTLKPDQEVAPGKKKKPCVEYVRYCAELIERNLIKTDSQED
jgi:C_GCAxxG_C_C family probable redox protein